jgi:hypothetical protein
MIEEDLRNETKKWLEKIKNEKLELLDESREDFLKNIKAYISDSEHFLEKNDLIHAFEAVIWAWSWLEIGREMGIIEDNRG